MAIRHVTSDVDTANPSGVAVAVTPDDDTDLGTTRALYVAYTGDLYVTMANGDVVPFLAIPAGSLLPIRVQKVMSTNTTAGGIVALY